MTLYKAPGQAVADIRFAGEAGNRGYAEDQARGLGEATAAYAKSMVGCGVNMPLAADDVPAPVVLPVRAVDRLPAEVPFAGLPAAPHGGTSPQQIAAEINRLGGAA